MTNSKNLSNTENHYLDLLMEFHDDPIENTTSCKNIDTIALVPVRWAYDYLDENEIGIPDDDRLKLNINTTHKKSESPYTRSLIVSPSKKIRFDTYRQIRTGWLYVLIETLQYPSFGGIAKTVESNFTEYKVDVGEGKYNFKEVLYEDNDIRNITISDNHFIPLKKTQIEENDSYFIERVASIVYSPVQWTTNLYKKYTSNFNDSKFTSAFSFQYYDSDLPKEEIETTDINTGEKKLTDVYLEATPINYLKKIADISDDGSDKTELLDFFRSTKIATKFIAKNNDRYTVQEVIDARKILTATIESTCTVEDNGVVGVLRDIIGEIEDLTFSLFLIDEKQKEFIKVRQYDLSIAQKCLELGCKPIIEITPKHIKDNALLFYQCVNDIANLLAKTERVAISQGTSPFYGSLASRFYYTKFNDLDGANNFKEKYNWQPSQKIWEGLYDKWDNSKKNHENIKLEELLQCLTDYQKIVHERTLRENELISLLITINPYIDSKDDGELTSNIFGFDPNNEDQHFKLLDITNQITELLSLTENGRKWLVQENIKPKTFIGYALYGFNKKIFDEINQTVFSTSTNSTSNLENTKKGHKTAKAINKILSADNVKILTEKYQQLSKFVNDKTKKLLTNISINLWTIYTQTINSKIYNITEVTNKILTDNYMLLIFSKESSTKILFKAENIYQKELAEWKKESDRLEGIVNKCWDEYNKKCRSHKKTTSNNLRILKQNANNAERKLREWSKEKPQKYDLVKETNKTIKKYYFYHQASQQYINKANPNILNTQSSKKIEKIVIPSQQEKTVSTNLMLSIIGAGLSIIDLIHTGSSANNILNSKTKQVVDKSIVLIYFTNNIGTFLAEVIKAKNPHCIYLPFLKKLNPTTAVFLNILTVIQQSNNINQSSTEKEKNLRIASASTSTVAGIAGLVEIAAAFGWSTGPAGAIVGGIATLVGVFLSILIENSRLTPLQEWLAHGYWGKEKEKYWGNPTNLEYNMKYSDTLLDHQIDIRNNLFLNELSTLYKILMEPAIRILPTVSNISYTDTIPDSAIKLNGCWIDMYFSPLIEIQPISIEVLGKIPGYKIDKNLIFCDYVKENSALPSAIPTNETASFISSTLAYEKKIPKGSKILTMSYYTPQNAGYNSNNTRVQRIWIPLPYNSLFGNEIVLTISFNYNIDQNTTNKAIYKYILNVKPKSEFDENKHSIICKESDVIRSTRFFNKNIKVEEKELKTYGSFEV